MFANMQNALPAGVVLDAESWVAIKKEMATRYVVRLLIAVAVAAAVALFAPGVLDWVNALPAPGLGNGPVLDTLVIVGLFTLWCGLLLWIQRDMCVGIIDARDPARAAAHSRWFVDWIVALVINGMFAWLMAVGGPLAMIFLVVPGLIGPSFLLAATGAEYYARHTGSEDAKAVCRTVFRTQIVPCMVAATVIFAAGFGVIMAVFGH